MSISDGRVSNGSCTAPGRYEAHQLMAVCQWFTELGPVTEGREMLCSPATNLPLGGPEASASLSPGLFPNKLVA